MSKKIGILTSGGDCAGLNAAIRGAVRRAIGTYGWQVVGIKEGTNGLMRRPIDAEELTWDSGGSFAMLRMGGTILGSVNKGDPFHMKDKDGNPKDITDMIIEGYHELGLDGLIAIGGDGSMHIMKRLADRGNMKVVVIPKTIDNDVGLTESSVGFDTAVQVATEALDRLQPTAASHNRVMILEVMGRDAGHIALTAGIAGGADVILIPEIPYKLAHIAKKIEAVRTRGRNFALVIVAEAVKTEEGKAVTQAFNDGQIRFGGVGHYLGDHIAKLTGAETRVTTLGHVQRGGTPSPSDRVLASAFGVHAVDLIAEGKFDRMVAWQNRSVIDVPIEDAVKAYQLVAPDSSLIRTARGLNICLGDE